MPLRDDALDLLIIVQARMGSTRYPRKVLLDLGGEPLLVRLFERIARVRTPTRMVCATTTEPQDDVIAKVCRAHGIEVFRGHPTDLLDRHYQAAKALGAANVAKIPSDCPLIDPAIIDKVIHRFAQGDSDYTSNLHPATYPDGNDVEIMTFDALASAWREAERAMEREHTTPFLWERPQRFHLSNVEWNTGRDYSMTHRWTLDYPEDYRFIREVFDTLTPSDPDFGLDAILDLLESQPQLREINARYAGVNWYRHHLHELNTVDAHQTRDTVSSSVHSPS